MNLFAAGLCALVDGGERGAQPQRLQLPQHFFGHALVGAQAAEGDAPLRGAVIDEVAPAVVAHAVAARSRVGDMQFATAVSAA